jgi:hypothetical protein
LAATSAMPEPMIPEPTMPTRLMVVVMRVRLPMGREGRANARSESNRAAA